MTSHEFVAGLVAEMQTVFARLGAREALEAESRGQVEIVPLLKAALRSEVEAPTTSGCGCSSPASACRRRPSSMRRVLSRSSAATK